MKLCVRRIDKAQDFVALAPIWAQLVKESEQLSPFFSYDWFWCCWHGVWPHRRPEILVIEESAGPLAIVPLMHWRTWVCGLPVRYVGFLECPNSPFVDLLTVGECGGVIETFLDHMASRSDWDTLWLQKIPAISPTLKALEGSLPGRLPWRRAGGLVSPYLEIEGDWGHFLNTKSPSVKDSYRRMQVQLQREGDIDFEEHRKIDLESSFFQEVLATMCHRYQRNWGRPVATMPRTREFFRELTRRASKNRWLSLWSLRLNGQLVALEYQLRSNGKVQALWTGNVTAYRESQPKNALQLMILQALFESGSVYEYSPGPGLEDAHPWWAAGYHETVHLKVYRPSFYTRLLHRLEADDVHGVQGASK